MQVRLVTCEAGLDGCLPSKRKLAMDGARRLPLLRWESQPRDPPYCRSSFALRKRRRGLWRGCLGRVEPRGAGARFWPSGSFYISRDRVLPAWPGGVDEGCVVADWHAVLDAGEVLAEEQDCG